eukprot:6214436-Pleurochrysis_carterae.AAC.2
MPRTNGNLRLGQQNTLWHRRAYFSCTLWLSLGGHSSRRASPDKLFWTYQSSFMSHFTPKRALSQDERFRDFGDRPPASQLFCMRYCDS